MTAAGMVSSSGPRFQERGASDPPIMFGVTSHFLSSPRAIHIISKMHFCGDTRNTVLIDIDQSEIVNDLASLSPNLRKMVLRMSTMTSSSRSAASSSWWWGFSTARTHADVENIKARISQAQRVIVTIHLPDTVGVQTRSNKMLHLIAAVAKSCKAAFPAMQVTNSLFTAFRDGVRLDTTDAFTRATSS